MTATVAATASIARAELARTRGCTWLYVDDGSALTPFYRGAGFRDSPAGVMRLARAT
jgi:hypothetical protein